MISALFTCSNLMVNVQAYTDFGGASTSAPALTYNTKGQVTNSWSYTAGTPGQVMVVQLIYQWPISAYHRLDLAQSGQGTAEVMGVSAFMVEPY